MKVSIYKFKNSSTIVVRNKSQFEISAGGYKAHFDFFFYIFYDEEFNVLRKEKSSDLEFHIEFEYDEEIQLTRKISQIDVLLKKLKQKGQINGE